MSRRASSRRAVRPASAARAAALVGALTALAPPASACPACVLSQGTDTLVFIAAFVLLPYAIVSGVIAWIRQILASEHEGGA